MGTGAPPLPPEHMWPTGDMPGEMRALMQAEAAAIGAAATHERVPAAVAVAPREFDAAALAAERPPLEGDELLASLRKVANGTNGHAAPSTPTYLPPRPSLPTSPADMHYAFPLSADGNRAEVNLYGKIGARDIELLVNYLKLTARKMKDGEAANSDLPEHHSDGSDENVRTKRSRVRSGAGR